MFIVIFILTMVLTCHGGVDSGAVSGNIQEKDFNLQAANYMYNRFKELGVPVTITRDKEKTLSRAERLNTMRSLGIDPNVIVLSNHINAGGAEFFSVGRLKLFIYNGFDKYKIKKIVII